jgi:hypothetical protein
VDLINTKDDKYSAYFFFGENADAAELIFDTGSDWMFVTSTECDTCVTKEYDRLGSSTSWVESYIPNLVFVSCISLT